MKVFLSFVAMAMVPLTGCSELFGLENIGARQYEMPPVIISGTRYEVYQRARSTLRTHDDPRLAPDAVIAFYARVGPNSTIYCGTTAGSCERAIRRYREGGLQTEERTGM